MYINAAECLEYYNTTWSEKVVVLSSRASLSGKELSKRVAAFSAAILKRPYTIGKGERILVLSHNSQHLIVAILAALHCGAIVVPANTRWSRREILSAMELCKPALILCEPALFGLVKDNECRCPTIFLGSAISGQLNLQYCGSAQTDTEHLIHEHRGASLGEPCPAESDTAIIVFTSGTTGAAKGVSLTHRTLSFQASAKIAGHGYHHNDVYLHTAPLTHVGGLVSWLAMLQVGATQVLMPKFSPEGVVGLTQQHRVSAMIAVPAMVADLVEYMRDSQRKASLILTSMKTLLLGGGEMHLSLRDPLLELMPNATVWTAFGMTECASSVTTCRLQDNVYSSSKGAVAVGHPSNGISIAIKPLGASEDPGTSSACPAGEIGEIVTRGPHTMLGYYNDAAATKAAFLPGGWLRTGDSGWIDACGQLWLVGRLKDVVRSGSENVSAGEVERVLNQHHAVKAAAVVGLPHWRLGEQVAALVQLKPGLGLEKKGVLAEELKEFCRKEGLAGFKIPRIILSQAEGLPANSSGKILKQEVRRMLGEQLSQPLSRL